MDPPAIGRLIQPIDDIDFLPAAGSTRGAERHRNPSIHHDDRHESARTDAATAAGGQIYSSQFGTMETLELSGALNRANGRLDLNGLVSRLEFSSS